MKLLQESKEESNNSQLAKVALKYHSFSRAPWPERGGGEAHQGQSGSDQKGMEAISK